MRRRSYWVVSGSLLLLLASVAFVLTAPLHGQFLESKSPRNALDGAFVFDLLREHPLHDPVSWAAAYYLRYPSLTILFYPPLLHVALAASYAMLGVSHAAAMVCIGCFVYALALGVYALALRVASPPAALAGALLLLAAPEVVEWGQQVLLEVPMMALATWGAVCVARYGDQMERGQGSARTLALAALLLVASIYTKQTAGFIAVGLALALLAWRGLNLLARPHVWVTAVIVIASLVPLALIQLRFGSFNLMSMVHRPDINGPDRFSLAGVSWYAWHLPAMAGWLMMMLAALSVVGAFWRSEWRLPRGDAWLLAGWLIATYAALSLIALKETRHGLPLLVPIAVFAAVTLDRLVRADRVRPILPGLAAALLGLVLWGHPVIGASGYTEAAALIGDLAPPNARVLFSGNRDGAFVFNIRALPSRWDISVIRADKLFLNVNIMPELGLNPRQMDRAEVARLLNRIGISYVVAVPHQWANETPVMAEFDAVLNSSQFQLVKRIPVTGPVVERELDVYRNTGPLSDPPESYDATLTAAGLHFESATPKR